MNLLMLNFIVSRQVKHRNIVIVTLLSSKMISKDVDYYSVKHKSVKVYIFRQVWEILKPYFSFSQSLVLHVTGKT